MDFRRLWKAALALHVGALVGCSGRIGDGLDGRDLNRVPPNLEITPDAAIDDASAVTDASRARDASLREEVDSKSSAPDNLSDFDLNRVVDCAGEFGYEKAFLFAGREVALTRDPTATQLMKNGSDQFAPLLPVTSLYSVPLYTSYVQYASLKDIADRLAVALVEPDEGFDSGFQYRLVLMISEGKLRGHVLSMHAASVNFESATFGSDRFTCRIAPASDSH